MRGATARLLAQRGLGEAAAAARFLDPRLGHLRAPEAAGQGIAGFAAAADRLMAALSAGTVIGVFGDYDVDGITSAAVLAGYLHELGGQVVTRVARRDGGYGFGVADAEALLEAGARLMMILWHRDLGSARAEAGARARRRRHRDRSSPRSRRAIRPRTRRCS